MYVLEPISSVTTHVGLLARYRYESWFASDPTVITNISINHITDKQVVITWDTNHLTQVSKVNYGTSISYGHTKIAQTLSDHHEVTLPDLTPKTTYYFEVMNQHRGYVFDAYYGFTTKAEGEVGEEGDNDGVFVPQVAIFLTDADVYKSPDTDSEVVTTAREGEEYRALIQQGAFVSILLPTGQEAYVLQEDVRYRDKVGSSSETR